MRGWLQHGWHHLWLRIISWGLHRITGSLSLEKASKIIRSNLWPNTTMPSKTNFMTSARTSLEPRTPSIYPCYSHTSEVSASSELLQDLCSCFPLLEQTCQGSAFTSPGAAGDSRYPQMLWCSWGARNWGDRRAAGGSAGGTPFSPHAAVPSSPKGHSSSDWKEIRPKIVSSKPCLLSRGTGAADSSTRVGPCHRNQQVTARVMLAPCPLF